MSERKNFYKYSFYCTNEACIFNSLPLLKIAGLHEVDDKNNKLDVPNCPLCGSKVEAKVNNSDPDYFIDGD